MLRTALLMDKMGNDTEGIVMVMVALAVLLLIVWHSGLFIKSVRRRLQKPNSGKREKGQYSSEPACLFPYSSLTSAGNPHSESGNR